MFRDEFSTSLYLYNEIFHLLHHKYIYVDATCDMSINIKHTSLSKFKLYICIQVCTMQNRSTKVYYRAWHLVMPLFFMLNTFLRCLSFNNSNIQLQVHVFLPLSTQANIPISFVTSFPILVMTTWKKTEGLQLQLTEKQN